MVLPGDNQSEKEPPTAEPRVPKIPSQPHPAPEPRMENPPKISPHITYSAAARNRNATRRQKMKLAAPTPYKNLLNYPNS